MSKRRWLELRTITVSARSTYGRAATTEAADRARDAALDLLTDLEQDVLEDGGDSDLLEAIDEARADLAES